MENKGMDLSGAMDMLKNMLSNSEGQQQIENIISMFGSETPELSQNPGVATGGIDPENIEMFMKIQKAMSAMSTGTNNSQARLLMALKPFLKPARQSKVDNAMKILQMKKAFEVMQDIQGE